MLESTRAKEAAVRKETTEQLEIFRRQQEEAEKAAFRERENEDAPLGEQQWTAPARKRRRAKEKDPLLGVKLRKLSTTAETSGSLEERQSPTKTSHTTPKDVESVKSPTKPDTEQRTPKPPHSGSHNNTFAATSSVLTSFKDKGSPPKQLGLGNYSSDED